MDTDKMMKAVKEMYPGMRLKLNRYGSESYGFCYTVTTKVHGKNYVLAEQLTEDTFQVDDQYKVWGFGLLKNKYPV